MVSDCVDDRGMMHEAEPGKFRGRVLSVLSVLPLRQCPRALLCPVASLSYRPFPRLLRSVAVFEQVCHKGICGKCSCRVSHNSNECGPSRLQAYKVKVCSRFGAL